MKLSICKVKRIERETGLMCLDDCIATVAEYYHCGYEMSYAGGFAMRWRSGFTNFAGQYQIHLLDRLENLKKYHGLEIVKKNFFSGKGVLRKIEKELTQKRPVMMQINPYWCPWDDGYGKYDANPGHMVLVTKVEQNGLICCDPYFEKEDQRLPLTLFYKGLQEVFFTNYHEPEPITRQERQDAVVNMYGALAGNGYFRGLRDFIQDASACPDLFYDVFLDEDLWISGLIIFLLQVNQSIQNLAVVTDYAGRRNEAPGAVEVAESLWNLAVRWKQARKLIVKLYFIRREDARLKERTLARLSGIVDELEQIAEHIEEVWDEKVEKEEIHVEPEMARIVCVPLEEYRNNRGFLHRERLEEEADFSSVGTCYVTEGEKREWSLGKYKYRLAALGEDIVDNIACDGQCVCIPRGRYSKISLIGSAEFGNSSDILRLQDQGKAAGEITIAFTDYINPPQCGESVAWKGHGVVKENGDWQEMKEVLYLYQQEYDMPAGEVSEILLPINPSIHIFAITIV